MVGEGIAEYLTYSIVCVFAQTANHLEKMHCGWICHIRYGLYRSAWRIYKNVLFKLGFAADLRGTQLCPQLAK